MSFVACGIQKAASSLEDQAAGTARQASTNTGTGAASDTALAAGDFASDTAAASADTLAGRQVQALQHVLPPLFASLQQE